MEVGSNPEVQAVELARLGATSPYRFLIHWCGLRRPTFGEMVRGDVLEHFNALYYEHIPWGKLRKYLRPMIARLVAMVRSVKRELWPKCGRLFEKRKSQ